MRDTICHSLDAGVGHNPVAASAVLSDGHALCFGKAHLLVALLRANGLPAGLCYQRLRMRGPDSPLVLHGLCAVYLPDHGWMRLDPRGGDNGFVVGQDSLAFRVEHPGECDFSSVWAAPWPALVALLHATPDARQYGERDRLIMPPVDGVRRDDLDRQNARLGLDA